MYATLFFVHVLVHVRLCNNNEATYVHCSDLFVIIFRIVRFIYSYLLVYNMLVIQLHHAGHAVTCRP